MTVYINELIFTEKTKYKELTNNISHKHIRVL